MNLVRRLHITPQHNPASSDPGTDKAVGWWLRATGVLSVLFTSLRLDGITHWQWWAVLMPLEVLAGALLLAAVVVVLWGLAWWASERPRALDVRRN